MSYDAVDTPDGYTVHFVSGKKGFVVRVTHGEISVADGRDFTTHTAAARWARRKIRDHKRARRILKRKGF